jgi:hypothetical protein
MFSSVSQRCSESYLVAGEEEYRMVALSTRGSEIKQVKSVGLLIQSIIYLLSIEISSKRPLESNLKRTFNQQILKMQLN